MKEFSIDINCDLGEGLDNESQLLPLISSCSIACGGHAGDEVSMSLCIALAKKHRVRIGAHPSYPDKENFGRRSLELAPNDLLESIGGQLSNFNAILEQHHAELHHIKAHGALYNDMVKDSILAENFIRAIKPFIKGAKLYTPYNSALAISAQHHNIGVIYEAFADRNYNEDLSLVSRSNSRALITDPELVLEHLVRMVLQKKVKTLQGELVPLKASTFCIHGDTSSALQILMYLAEELPRQQISIER